MTGIEAINISSRLFGIAHAAIKYYKAHYLVRSSYGIITGPDIAPKLHIQLFIPDKATPPATWAAPISEVFGPGDDEKITRAVRNLLIELRGLDKIEEIERAYEEDDETDTD